MKSYFWLFLIFCSFFPTKSLSAEDLLSKEDIMTLGVTQGLTEFLPVSSTGHMILVDHFFLPKTSSTSALEQEAKNAYFGIIQIGSVLAVLVYFRKRCGQIIRGIMGKDPQGRRLLISLTLSFLPAAGMGLWVHHFLKILYKPSIVAGMLILGAIIMFVAEHTYKQRQKSHPHVFTKNPIDYLSPWGALKIGLWQCLALIPGMSRSTTTIVGGYLCGWERKHAIEYSFLLGLVTLGAATSYECFRDFDILFLTFSPSLFLLGIGVAFMASLASIYVFLKLLLKFGLVPFAIYRLFLAGALFYFLVSWA